jgi:hypothetical protein
MQAMLTLRARPLHCATEFSPFDVSPEETTAAVKDILDSIGDTCPECPAGRSAPPRSADSEHVAMECSSLERTRLRADTGSRSLAFTAI